MSLILRYKFDEPTASLTTDSSGNSNTLVNVGDSVVSANDATFGNVAFFDKSLSGYFSLASPPSALQGTSPRTYSAWLKRSSDGIAYIHFNGVDDVGYRAQVNSFNFNIRVGSTNGPVDTAQDNVQNTWYHYVSTYDGSTTSLYFDGVFSDSASTPNEPTGTGPLYIGNIPDSPTSGLFDGYMSDFRAYDSVLDATAIAAIYSEGPNPQPPTVDITIFSHIADLTWPEVSGSTSYTITFIRDSGLEDTITNTQELSYSVYNLIPGSSYEFRVYSDIDPVTPVYTSTASTPSVDATSVTTLLTRLGNDITKLSASSVSDIESLIYSALSTGDIVDTNLGKTVFVENSDVITLDKTNESVLTPFQTSLGSGQSITVVLPDTTSNIVSYDETSDQITSGGVTYSVGDNFVLNGLKVSVIDL